MKLSIIVPVYNMAADNKLKYCMDSLVGQSLDDYEIIAIDDASQDESPEILREYERSWPGKVKVIVLPTNHHQGGAKNAGLDVASGEFIGFMDSDDWADKDMYKLMYEKAIETGADVVGCDYSKVYEHTMKPGDIYNNEAFEISGTLTEDDRRKLIPDPGHLVMRIYRREIFEKPKLRFPDRLFYEDNAVGTEIMMRTKVFAKVSKPLYFYYQHQDSTVHKISLSKCEDRTKAMGIFLDYAKNGGYLEKYRKEIEYRYTELFYINTMFSLMQDRTKGAYGFIKRLGREMKAQFPNFLSNEYLNARRNSEEIKLMKMQIQSNALFFIYYRLLWTYRRIRYKGK